MVWCINIQTRLKYLDYSSILWFSERTRNKETSPKRFIHIEHLYFSSSLCLLIIKFKKHKQKMLVATLRCLETVLEFHFAIIVCYVIDRFCGLSSLNCCFYLYLWNGFEYLIIPYLGFITYLRIPTHDTTTS